MTTQGPNSPGSASSDSTGDTPWESPTNALASDNTYTTGDGGFGGNATDLLIVSNFGFSIPGDATIDGILLEVEKSSSGAVDNEVRLRKGGSAAGDNKASGSWPGSETYVQYGGASDLWGTTWTPAEVNSADFGAGIRASINPFGTASIDHVQITVYYTEAAADPPAAIDDLAATPGVESLEFTWTAPDDGGAAISKYSLYLNGVLHTDEVTSPHEVTGLTGGVESGPWTVTATNSEGESDPSNAVSETPAEPPPAAPTNLAADTITSSSILLTWDDNSDDETGFELLYRYAGVGDFGAFDSPAADAESYNVTSLEPATAYDFRLVAVGSGGNSDPCDLLNVSTLSDTPPTVGRRKRRRRMTAN